VPLTLQDVASWVNGTVDGDGSLAIQRITSLNDARDGDLTLVAGKKNLRKWPQSQASAAVVALDHPADSRPVIRVADPLDAFLTILTRQRGDRSRPTGVDPSAIIHPSVVLGEGAFVGPYVSIGEGTTIGSGAIIHAGVRIGRQCTLGDAVQLYPNVVIYDDCTLGHRVTCHANSVIGADGFGYKLVQGKHTKIPQLGTVVVEDDVEIGACSTIDRGTVGPTRIGQGTKIDNLVMVSHNCIIGPNNILVAQVGLAGSCETGQYVVMAGQVGVADHVTIGDQAVLGAQSGVIGDVEAQATVLGTPSFPARDFLRYASSWPAIPGLKKNVKKILKHLQLDEDGA
jgi:UDP-3-O-[3-hydroxymyristoyl] glucosamine N-acyltransferase